MTKRNYDQEANDSSEQKYAHDFDWVVRAALLTRLQPYLVGKKNVLEVGSYMGDMTELILMSFPSIEIIEASARLCDVLKKRFKERVVVHNVAAESFSAEKLYDLIFLVHTLEHFDNPVGTLKVIRNFLAPQGHLIVAVPNADALSRQIAVRMGIISHNQAVTPGEYNHGHRRTYSLDTLSRDVRLANLTVIDQGGVIVKPLSNAQFDAALKSELISEAYILACDELSRIYPQLSASIYIVTTK